MEAKLRLNWKKVLLVTGSKLLGTILTQYYWTHIAMCVIKCKDFSHIFGPIRRAIQLDAGINTTYNNIVAMSGHIVPRIEFASSAA